MPATNQRRVTNAVVDQQAEDEARNRAVAVLTRLNRLGVGDAPVERPSIRQGAEPTSAGGQRPVPGGKAGAIEGARGRR